MPHRTLSSFSRRRWLAGAPLTAMAAFAGTADGNPRLEKLFLAFMAPCCWRENLLAHQSPKADELRATIRRQVAEGLSDDQIQAAFVKEFSTRILTHPEGVAGGLLRWTPWAAAAVGGKGGGRPDMARGGGTDAAALEQALALAAPFVEQGL